MHSVHEGGLGWSSCNRQGMGKIIAVACIRMQALTITMSLSKSVLRYHQQIPTAILEQHVKQRGHRDIHLMYNYSYKHGIGETEKNG